MEQKITALERDIAAAKTTIAVLETKANDIANQTSTLNKAFDGLHELTTAVKLLAEKQENTAGIVGKLEAKVEAIEAKPAKRWESIIEKIIMVFVAALAGYVIKSMGL